MNNGANTHFFRETIAAPSPFDANAFYNHKYTAPTQKELKKTSKNSFLLTCF